MTYGQFKCLGILCKYVGKKYAYLPPILLNTTFATKVNR